MQNDRLDFWLFEPVPGTFEWLKRNAQLNKVDGTRYKAFNLGMSDKAGHFDFYVPSANEAASLVANEDPFYRKKSSVYGEYTGSTEIDKVSCSVDTVDNFVGAHGIENICLIKIDVEGNEKFVLEGARRTLKEQKPLVYCELLRKHAKRFGYHPNDVIEFMAEIGYRCYKLVGDSLAEVMEIKDDTTETNFIFRI